MDGGTWKEGGRAPSHPHPKTPTAAAAAAGIPPTPHGNRQGTTAARATKPATQARATTGIHHIAGPEKCCFAFSENPIPLRRVTGILRTHQRCQHQAFVVFIGSGREFCFRDNFKWAVDTFNKFNLEESN
uniref:Chemokine interleukin-8-like domain-containing protein n=1 Tax=Oryzias latipes TaxID=8090 RepID=A0A3P9KUA4_ORYLA